MGRPKTPNKRECQLNIHLTRGEFDMIGKRAEAFGMPTVDYGRWVLLDGGKAAALPVPPKSRADRLLHAQLRRLGNLLNQMVRHLHQTGEVIPEAGPLLRDIRALLERSLL